MTESLVWEDYLTVGLYFGVVLVVGIWSTFRQNRGSTTGYFLAGKNMLWLPVGASIYASNVGAPMFVGMAGTAAASGFAVTIYEWHAVFIIISLGWLFVPVYIASGAFTMPEYLKKRFGGVRIRRYMSILALIMYVLRNISGEIYSGAVFMQQLLGLNLYLCVVTILAVVAIYTVIGANGSALESEQFLVTHHIDIAHHSPRQAGPYAGCNTIFTAGGLRAVIFTDTLQAFILMAGATVVTVISFNEVGGYNAILEKYKHAAPNYTLENQTFFECGMPREDSFHIFRDPLTADIPWTGATVGLTFLALSVWCQDQLIVQRCLSAKNMDHAKGGTVLAAALKIFSFPLFVLPGMISRILYPDEIACADPQKCQDVCKNEAGCSNLAYPLLVLRILPAGVRGLMLAALLASLMSTLTSVFNSASAIVTLDLWAQVRKNAKQAELMIVGRVTVLIMIGISILWLPILQAQQGGLLWFYIAAINAYLSVPLCMVFLLGMFWKDASEPGVFWGMLIGQAVGLVRLVMDMVLPPPVCGSGEPDKRLGIMSHVDFLHFAIINAIICTVVMVTISLFTKKRTEAQLHRVTWWTRHDTSDPELSDNEDDDEPSETGKTEEDGKMAIDDQTDQNRTNKTFSEKLRHACYNWVCGDTGQGEMHITKEERDLLRRKMTSISQNRRWTILLNLSAGFLVIAITFLFGYFA